MPIHNITHQPVEGSLHASYNPIVFRVKAFTTKTGYSTQVPPVVYCDIYIDDRYYKTSSKTMYVNNKGPYPEYEFDIQEALQEVMNYNLPPMDGNELVKFSNTLKKVHVKFRNAFIDTNGFTVSEQKEPVQETSLTPSIPGQGTISNSFFVLNSVIQHEEQQDLMQLLDSYKTGEWSDSTYPLTKRPEKIYLKNKDSSYFPVLLEQDIYYLCIEATLKDGTIQKECILMNVNNLVEKIEEIEKILLPIKLGSLLWWDDPIIPKEILEVYEIVESWYGYFPSIYDPNDPEFNQIGKVGGNLNNKITLTVDNLPEIKIPYKSPTIPGSHGGRGNEGFFVNETEETREAIINGKSIPVSILPKNKTAVLLRYKGSNKL